MKNKLVKSLSLLLATTLCVGCLTACANKSSDSGEKPWIDITDPNPSGGDEDQSWESTHDHVINVKVPEYKAIDSKLIENGESKYTVVVSENADASTYTAVSELNYFIGLSSGTSFPVISDNRAEWSTDAKYIVVGQNDVSDAAGMSLPDGLNSHGFGVKTIGNSLMLIGETSLGDIYAVYDVLENILGYEFYHGDEIAIAKTKDLNCPDFDYFDEPDIEYRSGAIGYATGMTAKRYRFDSATFIMPADGGSAWHNSFDYIPYETYGDDHGDWFADDLQNLCYTAHDREGAEYDLLVSTLADKWEKAILSQPQGDTLGFTHEDVGTWCTCSACSALKEKYGTDSASMIMFMNDVVDIVEEWRKATCPERNIRYVFFAYIATVKAPTKKENGEIKPIDENVQPRDKIGVIYAPILSDFIHGKSDPQNATYLEQMKEWHALVGDNVYYWFYQAYFYNYFIWYNNFDSMQDNYRTAVENGAVWMFDQSQYNNANSTGFQLLKAYLSSKLMWDTEADVAKLTDGFFDHYFRAASDTMRELFESVRHNFLWMSENMGVSGWIGIRVDNADYFKLNTLLEWQALIEKAYGDIEYLKETDAEMYKKLYDRIRLESLSVRYLIIDLYGTQLYTTKELYEQKQEFKRDCSELNITRLGEALLITTLWSQWGI